MHLKFMKFRTEYWKSNDKKYCDFCKCWITDNKPVSLRVFLTSFWKIHKFPFFLKFSNFSLFKFYKIERPIPREWQASQGECGQAAHRNREEECPGPENPRESQ